ncbi:MAG: leucine-rich repeat protein [Bacteroidales bacterium]|nr:leucine-rich repeat protein [Bacteroidales bacterium]
MKRFLLLLSAAISILCCSKPDPLPVKVTGISISSSSLSLFIGQKATLSATVTPSDAEDQSVIWESSDKSVATVDDGLVLGVSEGTATIKVTTKEGGFTASCAVTVAEEKHDISVTGVTLDKKQIDMVVDETAILTAVVSPSDATNPKISWTSSDASVASVNDGTVKAISPGEATITVTTEDGGHKATCSVIVKDKTHPVTSVSLDKSELILSLGGKATLVATVSPEDATDASVEWSSSDESIVLVDGGELTAVGEGAADVVVTTVDGGFQATCKVTVEPASNVIKYTTSDGEPVYINLPESVGNLVSNTYSGGIGLAIFEDEITEIGARAFQAATTLTSVTLPDCVASIGGEAFIGCYSLKEINIPSGVTSIGEASFAGCTSLEKFSGSFASSDGRCLIDGEKLIAFAPYGITDFKVPSDVKMIGKSVFSGCSDLSSLSLPKGLEVIGSGAFRDCSSLKSIEIPAGVGRIPTSAFAGCGSLSAVEIPSSVTAIDQYAFMECRSLQSMILPEGVEKLEDCSFQKCSSLSIVDLPSSMVRVGNNCFMDCSSLYSVTVRAENPPQLGGSVFVNVPRYCNFNVPSASLESYKASSWNDFNGRIYPIE